MAKNDQNLEQLILKAAKAIDLNTNRILEFAQVELSNEQLEIMQHLWNEDGIIQNKIAKLTLKDKGSVARMLENMEKKDLIVRITDKIDKRKKTVHLTNKGKTYETNCTKITKQLSDDFFKNIDKESLFNLKSSLDLIITNCSKIQKS